MQREKYIMAQGFKIVRFWNNDIFNNLEGVYDFIISVLNQGTTPPQNQQADFNPPARGGLKTKEKAASTSNNFARGGLKATLDNTEEACHG